MAVREGKPTDTQGVCALPIVCVMGLRGLPDVMGGIETHCENLYPRLFEKLSGRCKFVVLARRRYVRARLEHRGITVIPIWAPANKYLETIVHSIFAVFYARFRLRASVIHIHAIGPSLVAPLALMMGMRVIFTHHGEDYRRAKWNIFARTVLRCGERIAIRSAHQIISVSRTLAARLIARFPRCGPITFIPNGVMVEERARIEPEALRRFDVECGRYLLGVGRLVPEKGFQDLVAAFQNMRKADPGLKLVIVGDADHSDAFTRNLLGQRSADIIFTGRLPRSLVTDLYASAALFVLPSYHEGLPFVALEAIAAGAPVLLSDIDGNRELGLPELNYFRPGDIDTLRSRLELPSSDLVVDQDRVLSQFEWDTIISKTLAVYHSVLSQQ